MHPAQERKKGHLRAASEIQSSLISIWTQQAAYLQYLPPSLSVSLSFISQCLQRKTTTKKNPSFDSSFSNHPTPQCADRPSPLSPVVSTWRICNYRRVWGLIDECVWSHNAAQEESFCPGAIIRLTTLSSSVLGHRRNFLRVSYFLFHCMPVCISLFLSFHLFSQTCQVTCHCPAGYMVQRPQQDRDGDRRREVRTLRRKRADESVDLLWCIRLISVGWFCKKLQN